MLSTHTEIPESIVIVATLSLYNSGSLQQLSVSYNYDIILFYHTDLALICHVLLYFVAIVSLLFANSLIPLHTQYTICVLLVLLLACLYLVLFYFKLFNCVFFYLYTIIFLYSSI